MLYRTVIRFGWPLWARITKSPNCRAEIVVRRSFGCWLLVLAGVICAPVAADERALIDLGKLDLKSVAPNDAKVRRAGSPEKPILSLQLGHKSAWPGVMISAPSPGWDLSGAGYVLAEVKNVGSTSVKVGCRLDSPQSNKKNPPVQATAEVGPGQTAVIRVRLLRGLPPALSGKLFGMRGIPGGYTEKDGIDAAQVTELRVFASRPTSDSAIEVLSLRVGGQAALALPDDPAKVFPMIDALGQYRHIDWPGKTHSVADLARHTADEAQDLDAHRSPGDWDQYGGWKAGPQLRATGFFYPIKHEGKWWLVDPEGRLFWSHGIDCVRADASTPITDRRHWFQQLPEPGSPEAQFYGKGSWAPHGYYQGKRYETFNFYGLNLWRKYGSSWNERFIDVVHRRLRSWGLNTVANWSDDKVYLARKTPYVACIHFSSKVIEGSTGYWGQFSDVFDPSFSESLRKAMAKEQGRSAGDPWCIGYFLGNELGWGEELSLAMAALASPANQRAKQVFVDDLKAKYASIEDLNRVWGTSHASWAALAESRQAPDKKKAYDDLAAFATRIDEQFFRLCREAVKAVAPHNLYLGCRFAWANERAVRASAKYCDVVSYNLYRESVADFRLAEGIDMPVVIGEFHFGALDRGMFHTGLRPTENQAARAAAYRNYVQGALSNPCLVGSHWFQWADQATTGRGDGENYQIGFVDVCDTPYPETIQASREVGYSLYKTRLGGK